MLRIGLALCGALEHAHGRGVVHRDVKPQNVLVPDAPRSAAAWPSWRTSASPTWRATSPDPHRRRRRHARLHGPRAGRRQARRRALRPLQPRARALRGAGGDQSDPRRLARRDRAPGRNRPPDPEALAARTCRRSCARRSTARCGRGPTSAGRWTSSPPSSRSRSPRSPTRAERSRRTRSSAPSRSARCPAAPPRRWRRCWPAAWRPPRCSGRASRCSPRSPPSPRVAVLPRIGWLVTAVAVIAVLADQQPGAAVLVAAALAPVPLALRSRGTAWSVPALAPLLGLGGVAGRVSGPRRPRARPADPHRPRRARRVVGAARGAAARRALGGAPRPRRSWRSTRSRPPARRQRGAGPRRSPLLTSGALLYAGPVGARRARAPVARQGPVAGRGRRRGLDVGGRARRLDRRDRPVHRRPRAAWNDPRRRVGRRFRGRGTTPPGGAGAQYPARRHGSTTRTPRRWGMPDRDHTRSPPRRRSRPFGSTASIDWAIAAVEAPSAAAQIEAGDDVCRQPAPTHQPREAGAPRPPTGRRRAAHRRSAVAVITSSKRRIRGRRDGAARRRGSASPSRGAAKQRPPRRRALRAAARVSGPRARPARAAQAPATVARPSSGASAGTDQAVPRRRNASGTGAERGGDEHRRAGLLVGQDGEQRDRRDQPADPRQHRDSRSTAARAGSNRLGRPTAARRPSSRRPGGRRRRGRRREAAGRTARSARAGAARPCRPRRRPPGSDSASSAASSSIVPRSSGLGRRARSIARQSSSGRSLRARRSGGRTVPNPPRRRGGGAGQGREDRADAAGGGGGSWLDRVAMPFASPRRRSRCPTKGTCAPT